MPERDSLSSPESKYPKITSIVPCLQGKRNKELISCGLGSCGLGSCSLDHVARAPSPAKSVIRATRRIGATCAVHIHVQTARAINSRGVAVIAGIIIPAHCAVIRAPGRLCELSDLGKANTTLSRIRRSRECAARRRRTNVVRHPVGDVSTVRCSVNVICGHDRGLTLFGWNA